MRKSNDEARCVSNFPTFPAPIAIDQIIADEDGDIHVIERDENNIVVGETCYPGGGPVGDAVNALIDWIQGGAKGALLVEHV